jgi:hypothetical protein
MEPAFLEEAHIEHQFGTDFSKIPNFRQLPKFLTDQFGEGRTRWSQSVDNGLQSNI